MMGAMVADVRDDRRQRVGERTMLEEMTATARFKSGQQTFDVARCCLVIEVTRCVP